MHHGPILPYSQDLHAKKYRGEGETFREGMNRVGSALKDSDEHFHAFRDILLDMRFMPAGRIQSAMGSPRQTTPYNPLDGNQILLHMLHNSSATY